MTNRVAITAGVNGPNLDTLPIVHFAACGRWVVHTDAPAKVGRDEAIGVAETKAGADMVECCGWIVMLIALIGVVPCG